MNSGVLCKVEQVCIRIKYNLSIPMSFRKIHFKPRGKNSKVVYQWHCLCHRMAPIFWLRKRAKTLLASFETRLDQDYILERVNYYCKLKGNNFINGEYQLSSMPKAKNNYFRDFFEYSRFFDGGLKVDTAFGDNISIPKTPSITKSRPISGDNANCVLCNLDKVRHFTFLRDKLKFEDKTDKAIFRAAIYQPHRIDFMEKYFGSEWVNCGDVGTAKRNPEWKVTLITLYDHLVYKFIVALEGNDVASNLKWIMSSNSIAVMPKPKYETWFMEGTLKPNFHYIEIKDDYSDLPERLQYYIDHPEEAKQIIKNAHEYVKQFFDKEREDLIHLLVLEKYFSLTNKGHVLMK